MYVYCIQEAYVDFEQIALFERCQHSTEFHFPDIETQLTVIEQDYNSRPESLQEGSFFITRHSNLPSTQVIFHLVVDSECKFICYPHDLYTKRIDL